MATTVNDSSVPAPTPRGGGNWIYLGVVGFSLALAVGLIVLVDLTQGETVKALLIDRERSTWPLTVQNVMWLLFAFGCAELVVRLIEARSEMSELHSGYLPEDDRTILQGPELRLAYSRLKEAMDADERLQQRFLPRLIMRVIAQFQTTKSVEQSTAIMNASLELYIHEVDIRYNMIRYVVWAIPALGFIGTVIGISLALNFASNVDLQDPSLLVELTKRLGVAFNTTLLALAMSILLVLGQHKIQAFEERSLNRAGQYCLDNLINRLYVS
ncbi:MAG: MotA/TolQ/ExbB proton channel family protein [Pseudomonadota bacterium]